MLLYILYYYYIFLKNYITIINLIIFMVNIFIYEKEKKKLIFLVFVDKVDKTIGFPIYRFN